MMKYIPEMRLFGMSMVYLLLYILDDIRFISVPNWVLTIDMTFLSLMLMMIVNFLKIHVTGKQNEHM